MTDENIKEAISALMDGELDGPEMERSLHGLHSTPEQRQTWQCYHLIGDALRKNLPPHLDSSFVHRVNQAIAADVLPGSPVVELKPTPSPKPRTSPRPLAAVSKPLAGFALAASVAAVAYLGVGMIAVDEQATASRLATSNVPPLVESQAAVVPVVPLDGVRTVKGQRWNVATPAVESKLNTYLSDHHTMSSMMAMNNRMLPSIRLVDSRPVQGE